MAVILHVCTIHEWQARLHENEYWPAAFPVRDGFIHCCLERQLSGVLERYFIGKHDLLVLQIDEDKITAEVRYEEGPDHDLYPHVYGPLNKTAIARLEKIR